jgi:peroxiredoxin
MSLRFPTLSSNNFSGLLNQRFWDNFLPVPATNLMAIGELVPDFELPESSQNQRIRLASTRSQGPVLLAFTRIFTEHQYCPLCLPQIQALNQSAEQFQQQGITVLMITSTDEIQSQQIAKDLALNFPLLSNPSCSIFRRYGTGQALGAPLPAQFLIDAEGKLLFKHVFSFFEPNASPETLLQVLSSPKPA